MRRVLRILAVVVAFVAVLGYVAFRYTKSHSPAQSVRATSASGLAVQVDYSRPYKKERIIFGGLVPWGTVWRTGANEATLISFSKDASFGGKPIKAGQYSLFTIPSEGEWTVILNRQTGQWGLTYDPNKDEARVNVKPVRHPAVTEQLTITLPVEGDHLALDLDWDQTALRVPMKG